jgi:hypothetical protein
MQNGQGARADKDNDPNCQHDPADLPTSNKRLEQFCQEKDKLAKPYERGETERMRTMFIELQSTIEAIDRAIVDEHKIEDKPDQIAGVTIKIVEPTR